MSIIHDRQYEKEFSIRHRMPRPIARSYEAVAFATNSEESEQKIIWCASVAIRFLSAVRQANHLALNPGVPLNPPSFTDLRLDVGGGAFVPELDAAAAAPLAHLAGIYSDRPLGIDNLALRRALARITFLCRFRLVAVERDGFRLLVGPRMEREIWNGDHHLILEKLPPGSVFLYEPDARSFLCLSPLLEWVRPPESPFGRLFLLRRLDGNTGYYIEEGIPGSRGMARETGALPVTGARDAPDDVCRKLALPPGGFPTGLNSTASTERLASSGRAAHRTSTSQGGCRTKSSSCSKHTSTRPRLRRQLLPVPRRGAHLRLHRPPPGDQAGQANHSRFRGDARTGNGPAGIAARPDRVQWRAFGVDGG
jgi:hypothetical protein